jgi:outer membrane protein
MMRSMALEPRPFALAAALALAAVGPAAAVESATPKPDWLVTAILGPQFKPAFPGDDTVRPGPYIRLIIRHPGDPLDFTAPGQSPGIGLLGHGSRFDLGPVVYVQPKRRDKDVGAPVGEVGLTVEAGGFAQAWLTRQLRLRAEVRRGIGGHNGLVGAVGADAVIRDGDRTIFSLGPRLDWSDARYQRAYFGVTPVVAARTGLLPYRPGGGVHGVGAAASLFHQLGPVWGFSAYAGYDRLVGHGGVSPIVRGLGSRNQFSAGIGMAYTFSIRRH